MPSAAGGPAGGALEAAGTQAKVVAPPEQRTVIKGRGLNDGDSGAQPSPWSTPDDSSSAAGLPADRRRLHR